MAIFLTELCPRPLRRPIGIAIELLAGIPSIIYGIWGLFVFAPWFQAHVQQPIIDATDGIPLIGTLFGGAPYGIGIFTAGLILSIMILPFISAVTRDVFETVPAMLKEATYGLGCTTWEVMWRVVLPYARSGVVGGAMLALGRALGETMAVTFVIGNAHSIDPSLFAPGTTISATIANEFTEATSAALHLLTDLAGPDPVLHHLHRAGLRPADAALAGAASGDQMTVSRSALSAPPRSPTAFSSRFLSRPPFSAWSGWASFCRRCCRKAFPRSRPPCSPIRRRRRASRADLFNAILGSVLMSVVAVFIGTPIGLFAGTYLAEYGKHTRFAFVVRFVNDILLSAPSIVTGLFVYEIVVLPMGHFSAWAGALSLMVIVIPVVVRTTENMLILVPSGLREAASALGAPMSFVIRSVTWKAAQAGIVTGVLLAIARISGETAPLLFTALNNQFLSTNFNAPMASLPAVIYQYALSPYDDWHRLAWAGALLVTATVLTLSIIARLLETKRN